VDYTAQLMAAWEQANLKKAGDKLKPYKYEPQYGADQSLRGKTIILDPGHGGSDPGAFARGGRPEKELTLRTARLLAERLSRLGATVYLTRNDDRRYNLKDIVNYANRSGADIFICIHYNSSRKPRTAGTETYYYNPYSRRLARNIHISLIGELRRPDRGLRRAMFYTVHHTRMPAVLIEPLFLSNDQEERLAWSTDFQDQLVRALVKGVKQYF
jgi:N-acetylmuramoyl-L-alanine amidase